MSKVSVIVPNYNHAQYLRQRIDSILAQTFQDFELILLDDCSSDKSIEIIEEYKKNEHVSCIGYNAANSGSAFNQWKKGVERANGEWIWIAESDDMADPVFLEYMLMCADSHPECGLVYSLPDKKTDNSDCIEFSGRDFIKDKLVYGNAITNASGILLRRELFLSINYDQIRGMRLCGDWFIYVLMAENTNVLFCPLVHSFYRRHENNSSLGMKHAGLSYLEGINVLDYIINRHKVPVLWVYAKWGNSLAANSIIYSYDKSVIKSIIEKFKHEHKLIIFFYHIFIVRWRLHFRFND